MRASAVRQRIGLVATAATLAASTVMGGAASAASTVKTSPFAVSGTIVQTAVNVPPNVDGVTGGFILDKEVATPNDVNNAADSDGNVTILTRGDTGYHVCDSNGENCHKSTGPQVVIAGAHVKVMGRYYVTNGEYHLIAYDVWSPTKAPPPPPPASGPNPQPKGVHDYTNGNLFGVRGEVVATKVDALNGFKIGRFDAYNPYGCGLIPGCKVQRIATAHADRITIEPRVGTTYYASTDNGCTYSKTTDSYDVIYRKGPVDGLKVSGRYTWGGLDWVFTATKVWTPAPKPPGACSFGTQGGPLDVYVPNLVETDSGTYDAGTEASPETYTNTQWQGSNGIGNFGAGATVMQLDWVAVDGGWEFFGTYQVAAPEPDATSISGDIQGTATPQSSDPSETQWDVNAQLTIEQTSGKYMGWEGDGQWTATGSGDSGWSAPPFVQTGTIRWMIAKS